MVFQSTSLRIHSDWIDYNGHLNMAYYSVLFDLGTDQVWDSMGFGPDYRSSSGCTTYTAEFHIRYLRELHLTDQVQVSFQLLDLDEKRLHFFQEMRHVDGWLAATGEGIALHVDQSGPKVCPMPAGIYARFLAMCQSHAPLPRSEAIGKPIGLRRKTSS